MRCQVQCFKSCLHGTTPTTETTSRDKNMHDWIKLCTGGSSGDRIEKKCIISIGFHRDKYAKSPVGTGKKYSLWCHMIVLSLFDTCHVTRPALRDNRNMDLKTYVSNLRTGKTYRLDQRIVDWTSRTAFKKAVLKGVENLFRIIKHK